MPDKIVNQATTIYADIPAFASSPTVTVTNPLGVAVISGGATTVSSTGQRRYQFTASAGNLSISGIYVAAYVLGGNTFTQEFTVGSRFNGLTKWDIRLGAVAREGEVIEGEIANAESALITDAELIGGVGNYQGRWMMLHPDTATIANIGVTRRVKTFNGSAIVLSRPFPVTPNSGEKYAMFTVSPAEAERAMKDAIRDLAQVARVPVTVTGLVLAAHPERADWWVATLPTGMISVDSVWVRNASSTPKANGVQFLNEWWEMFPDRKLVLETTSFKAGDTIDIRGMRELRFPQWDDSVIEVESSALEAVMAVKILATRGGSPAIDTGDHLRRTAMAQQEYEINLPRSYTRPDGDSRVILP